MWKGDSLVCRFDICSEWTTLLFDEPYVNGESYFRVLKHQLVPMVGEFLKNMNFQKHVAPSRYILAVRHFLDAGKRNSWISRGGPATRPARYSELKPGYFFL